MIHWFLQCNIYYVVMCWLFCVTFTWKLYSCFTFFIMEWNGNSYGSKTMVSNKIREVISPLKNWNFFSTGNAWVVDDGHNWQQFLLNGPIVLLSLSKANVFIDHNPTCPSLIRESNPPTPNSLASVSKINSYFISG